MKKVLDFSFKIFLILSAILQSLHAVVETVEIKGYLYE